MLYQLAFINIVLFAYSQCCIRYCSALFSLLLGDGIALGWLKSLLITARKFRLLFRLHVYGSCTCHTYDHQFGHCSIPIRSLERREFLVYRVLFGCCPGVFIPFNNYKNGGCTFFNSSKTFYIVKNN